MRITRLQAENFKRLKAVDITPDPEANAVVIGGRNAQGKSSVLDGIMAALSGKKGSKELVRPIRDGETQASVVVELDDLIVTRTWKASGSTVTVSPAASPKSKLSSPQAILDKLIGALAFDPLAFAESDAKAQVETLIDLIGREAFDALAAERRAAYEERTEVNRQAKSLRAQLDAAVDEVPRTYDGTERRDTGKLSIELEAAIEVERAREEWQVIEDRIASLREQQANLAAKAQDVVAAVKPRPSEEVRQLLASADDHNRAHDASARALELGLELAGAEGSSEGLSNRILALDHERAGLIANADLPVDGLTFDDEGISFNGVPFQQSSAAERLKVSVAMAMAMNPELRVICIRDASLLDDESKAALVAMAAEHDYQIWLEVVGDRDEEIAVVIEDGEVRA